MPFFRQCARQEDRQHDAVNRSSVIATPDTHQAQARSADQNTGMRRTCSACQLMCTSLWKASLPQTDTITGADFLRRCWPKEHLRTAPQHRHEPRTTEDEGPIVEPLSFATSEGIQYLIQSNSAATAPEKCNLGSRTDGLASRMAAHTRRIAELASSALPSQSSTGQG